MRNPNSFGGRAAEDHGPGGGADGESLIVVAVDEAKLGSGANATRFEEFEEMTVALVDAADGVGLAGFGVGEQDESSAAAAGGTFQFAQIAVRAGLPASQLGHEAGFEVRGDGVFEALRFVVHLVPGHIEDFAEHAFDEVVALGQLAGDLFSGRGQANAAFVVDADKSIFLQAADGHRDSRRGNVEPMSERGGDDGFSLAFGFEDRLEVIFFGNGDHWNGIIRQD